MRPIVAGVTAALGLAAAGAGAEATTKVIATPPVEQPATSTIFLPFGKGVTIDTWVDAALVKAPSEHEAWLVDMRAYMATMIDSFDSNPHAGDHCAGGKERYVRLLDTAGKREVFHMLIESCVRGLTVADPAVTWEADGSGFTIHRIGAPPVRVAVDSGAREARIIE